MTIKVLLTGAALSLPMAAQAAPVPIFESLDGITVIPDRGFIGQEVNFTPLNPDFIEFSASFVGTQFQTDLVVLDEDGSTIALESDTLVALDSVAIGIPSVSNPRVQRNALFQLGDLSGRDAALFRSSAYLSLTYDDEVDVFVSDTGRVTFGDIEGVDVAIYATAPSPIPVPATLPLLAGALGIGALALRRRAS